MEKKFFTPCSPLNYELLERWLDEKAYEGFFLKKDGFRVTYAKFTESESRKVIHRIWPKDGLNEYGDARKLRESYGWEFVSSSQDYDFYRADSEDALRINEDVNHCHYCKKAIKKRILWRVLLFPFSLLPFIFTFLILPYIIILIPSGIIMAAVLALAFLCEAIKIILNTLIFIRIRKNQNCELAEHKINWKKKATLYQIPNVMSIVLLTAFLFILLFARVDTPVSASLPEDKSDIPFATVADFTDDKSSYIPRKFILNAYEEWETHVSPVNYDWGESAKIKADDGNEIVYGINVGYHETIHPLIARAVAELYIIKARTTPYAFGFFSECPSFGFDYEVMYYSEAGDAFYVFQDGNKIIHFTLGCFGELPEEFDMEKFDNKCLKIIADSFKG